jgi:hypothetical protein
MATPTEIYVVRRAEVWELKPAWFGVWSYKASKNGGVIRAFADRRRAESFCAKLEGRKRSKPLSPGVNPFVCSRKYEMQYDQVSSFPEPVLDDWLRDAGLTPPVSLFPQPGRPRCSHDWYYWWRQTAPRMTPEQRRRVWEALDRVRFYEVVALPLE